MAEACAVPVLYWSRCGPGLDHLHCNADMLFMRLFAVCVRAITRFQDSIRDFLCYLESKDLILLFWCILTRASVRVDMLI